MNINLSGYLLSPCDYTKQPLPLSQNYPKLGDKLHGPFNVSNCLSSLAVHGASVKLISCITLSAPLGNLLSVKLIFICYFIYSLREPYEMAAVIPILEVKKKTKQNKTRGSEGEITCS